MEQELITLGILFLFALIGGILATRFKQPMLMGLLLVGAFIGPHMFGLVTNLNMISMMIDFGAILMLFMIGLEFDLSKLKKIGLKAIIVGMLKSAVVVFVGFNVGLLLGLGVQASLFIGVIIAFSSTVVIVKVLEEKNLMERQEVPLIIAVLIIEDILAVLMLTFFSGIIDKSAGMIGTLQNMAISMGILVLGYILFVKFAKPLLVKILKGNNSDEIMTFMALAMCAGFSYLAYYLKLSPAAGAFLAGSIVASLPESKRFEKAISPYNLMISSLFFIAVGTMVNFQSVQANIMLILILVLTVIITRLFAFGIIVYLFANFKGDKMFFSSMAMFSVGEFALLIAQESQKFNIGLDLMSISAAIIFITAMLMSLTLNYSEKLYNPANASIPYKFRKKLDNYAEKIRSLSEELDMDNNHSQNLKNNLFKAMIGFIILIITIIGWRKASVLVESSISPILFTTIYLIIYIIIAACMFYIIYRMKKFSKSFSEIFANATNNRTLTGNGHVIRKTVISFALLMIALLFPFIMFMFNLKVIFVIVPFVLITLSIMQMKRISGSSSKYSERSYNTLTSNKFSFKTSKKESTVSSSNYRTKNINNGWKI